MDKFSPQWVCYRPSGTAPLVGTAAILAIGCAAGSILAAVYAFLNHHDPSIYLNAVLVLIWGKTMGWILAKGIHKFRIRSFFAAAATATAVFAVSYVLHWFVYIAAVLADFELDSPYDIAAIAELALVFMQEPRAAWECILAFNHEGVWSLSSSSGKNSEAVKGLFLAAVWAAEALVLFYYSLKAPLEETGKPYSERLGEWIEPRTSPCSVAFIEDVQGFKDAVARNDYSALTAPLPEYAEYAESGNFVRKRYASVVLYPDPLEPYVSVQNVTKKAKKKDVSVKNVVRYLKISPATAQSIAAALGLAPGSQPEEA